MVSRFVDLVQETSYVILRYLFDSLVVGSVPCAVHI